MLIASLGMFTLAVGFILTGQLMGGRAAGAVHPLRDGAARTGRRTPRRCRHRRARVAGCAAGRHAAAALSRLHHRPRQFAVAIASASPPDSHGAAAIAPRWSQTRPAAGRPRRASRAASVSSRGRRPRSPAWACPIEAIEGLAAALGTAGDSGRRIAVVGARRNMGTTLAAISLARALAKQGRAVLVDLALESPNLSVIASDANAPGPERAGQGSASFGQIITRDRYSRVHLITVGKAKADSDAILSSQRLAITLEALARSYDYVVLDAGALPEISPEKFARLAPRAVLVADDIDGPATESARERLLSAGFPNVSVLASAPDGPESDAGGSAGGSLTRA